MTKMRKKTTKINSDSRPTKFNFTLYERLDTIKQHIDNIFASKDCKFDKFQFQFEPNDSASKPGRYHAQGYASFRKGKQLKVGWYDSMTKKGAGIKKEIFEANAHIEFANGTEEQCLAYTSKDYNRCKNPDHQPCKCDLFDLSKTCENCDETCKRTFARISKDSNIAGPFIWVYDELEFNNNDKEDDIDYYDEAMKEVKEGKDLYKVFVKYSDKCKRWQYTTQVYKDVARGIKEESINPLQNVDRFWEPCIIYIYGDKGTGKSKLCTELFPGIYEKDDMKQFENYNDAEFDYNRDTAIFIDDFYGTSISWTNLLRLTDRNHPKMDVKYGKTKIVAMYICITGNGPIENLYRKMRESNSSIDIGAFSRRIRYIIKFEGEPIDPRIGKGDVIRIFEKGSKQDFNNRIFDIEFNANTTFKQVEEITLKLGIEGEIYQDEKTGFYYWRRI
jgi:hypothetical protein